MQKKKEKDKQDLKHVLQVTFNQAEVNEERM